jgi:hypothetical protein
MYIINREENNLQKIDVKSFAELGFTERRNLQTWIAKKPECLGEELLIIQEEFDGFNDTTERLDLLALDLQGNLVVIENKLDSSGRDVTWQALKYASYCSTLKGEQIRKIYQAYLDKKSPGQKAEENIIEFLDANSFKEINLNSGQTQRIILIAANFKKEVTSTVLWLLNYKLRIQCFKVTPFDNNGTLMLNIEQIIPMREVEDYVIRIAEKTQEDISVQEELKARHVLRLEFWRQFLATVNDKTQLYHNVNATKDNWLAGSTGISGVGFHCVISNYYARVEVYIQRKSRDKNKMIFDELLKMKAEVEREFGANLEWERLDDKKACRIKYELNDVDYFNKEDWEKMIKFMSDALPRLERTFQPHITRIRTKLKSAE